MKKIKLLLLFAFIINKFCYSQSCHGVKELLRKRHTISGMTYGHPYTMFDRHNKLSLDSMISNIRNRINDEKSKDGPLFKAYQAIYNNATSAMPTDDGTMNIIDKTPSKLAIWAKNNAFVFLVGLDENGELIYKQFKSTTIYENNKTT
jgi:hypothetical protein